MTTIALRAEDRGMNWDDFLKLAFTTVAGLFGTGGLVVFLKSWLSHRKSTRTVEHRQEMEREAMETTREGNHIARLESRIVALEAKLEQGSAERLGLHGQIAALQLRVGKLDGENRGLRRQVADLQEENVRLRTSVTEVDHNPSNAVIVCSEGGTIVEWSAGARALFHYETRDVIGMNASMLVPGRLRTAHHDGMQKAAGSDLPFPQVVHETVARTREGTEIPVKIVINSWEEKGHRMFEAVIRRRETAADSLSDSGGLPLPKRRRRGTDHVERGEGLDTTHEETE